MLYASYVKLATDFVLALELALVTVSSFNPLALEMDI